MTRLLPGSLVALLLAASAGASTPRTRVLVYHPFAGAKLARGLTVARAARGYCWTGSAADARADAWRCFIGNEIVDPCFSDPHVSGWVACPADGTPFGTRLIRLDLTKPLPRKLGNRGRPGQGDPWAIELAGGKVCAFLTGATTGYHGRRMSYGCTRTVFLAGSPDRSHPTWTIVLGTGLRSPPRTAAIAVAAW